MSKVIFKTRRALTNALYLLTTQLYESKNSIYHKSEFISSPTALHAGDDLDSYCLSVEAWIVEILTKAHKFKDVNVYVGFEGNQLHIRASAKNWHGKIIQTQDNYKVIAHLPDKAVFSNV